MSERKDKFVVAIVLLHTFATREILNHTSTMSSLALFGIGGYVIGMVFFTYIFFIADPSKSRLAYLTRVEWPPKINKFFTARIGVANINRLSSLSDRFLGLFYVVIVGGCWSAIFFFTYPWLDASEGYVSSYHKIMGYIVFFVCIVSWRFASQKSPGVITAQTLEKYDNYPYDGLLFVKDRICPTVGIPKLARSKYDRFAGIHVSKFDHFCGWICNSVGEENYRWFLLFLLVHVCMCAYGSFIVGHLFQHEVEKNKLWDVVYFNRVNGEEFNATAYIVFQYLFQRYKLHAALLLMMSVMGFVLSLFLGYHIWIASRGMTTNETAKWDQVKTWHRAELKRYKKAVKEGLVVEESTSKGSKPPVSDGDVTCTGAAAEDKAEEETESEKITHPGPFPKNIYNVGFVENWRDVLYPRSMRKEAIESHRKAAKERQGQPIDPNKSKAS
jgi:hypothetical protein